MKDKKQARRSVFGCAAAGVLAAFTAAGTVSAQCVDSSKIDAGAACIEIYSPVCGCNNVTYSNSCFAETAGVLSFSPGACATEAPETFWLLDSTVTEGDTALIGWDAKCKCAIDWTVYEAVSFQPYVANVIAGGKIETYYAGIAEIRITKRATKQSVSLFLQVQPNGSPQVPVFGNSIRYLPTKVDGAGNYTVSLYCKALFDCCNTHTLSAQLTDKLTITLSVSSTKMLCSEPDTCTHELVTEMSGLPEGMYQIVLGRDYILMDLGDTTSSQVYKMKLDSQVTAAGDRAQVVTVDNSSIDWSKFTAKSSNNTVVSVTSNGVVTALKQGYAQITVTEISSGAIFYWSSLIGDARQYFVKDKIVLYAGQTAALPVHADMNSDCYFYDLTSPIISIDTATKTVTALAIGSERIYSSNRVTNNIDALQVTVNDAIAEKTTIQNITVVDGGLGIEIKFDHPVFLYEGIEKDFVIAADNGLKLGATYTVTKVALKNGDNTTLVLTMESAVPANAFSVQFQELKSYTVAVTQVLTDERVARIIPNPARTSVTLTADGLLEGRIETIGGKPVAASAACSGSVVLQVSQLPAGQYIARFVTVNGTETILFTKE